ncbi:MAG: addiction module protein [Propionibacteriaceae bacterium]|jgi:hypothetical protein|nr:addiction module protein [Propionibacteriaceae bacterium]
MVSPALRESLEALTPAERVAVIDSLQRSLVPGVGLAEPEKTLIRQREAELEATSSAGLTWAELRAGLRSGQCGAARP